MYFMFVELVDSTCNGFSIQVIHLNTAPFSREGKLVLPMLKQFLSLATVNLKIPMHVLFVVTKMLSTRVQYKKITNQ